MYERTERAIEYLREGKVKLLKKAVELWSVGKWVVTVDPNANTYDCNCPDHDPEKGNITWCKHMQSVWIKKHCV